MAGERVLGVIVVVLVVGAMVWGVFARSSAFPCDAAGRADSHSSHFCYPCDASGRTDRHGTHLCGK